MKHVKVGLLLLCVFGSLSLHAQLINHYGVKAGMSIANQSLVFTPLDMLWPTDVIISPGVLLFLESFSGEKVSMQMELGYMGKGFSSTVQSISINHLNNDSIILNEGPRTTSRFHYISFSPTVRYRQELEKVVFYTLLGPRIDWLRHYTTSSDYPLENQHEIIIGLTGAFGVEYRVNYLTLDYLGIFAEIQYQPDLRPLNNIAPLLVNNNCILLAAGLRF